MKTRFVVAALLGLSILSASGVEAAPYAQTVTSPQAGFDLLRGAASGDVALIKSALKRKAPLEVRDNRYFFTPLGWAAWRGHTQAVRTLIAAGADVNAQVSGGAPMPITLRLPLLGETTAPEPSDQTPLVLAILGDHPQATEVCVELLKNGANPSARNTAGITPLIYACMRSPSRLINALLDKGADASARDYRGIISPLIMASLQADGENLPLVKRLLDSGADPNDIFIKRPLPFMLRFAKRPKTASLIEGAQKTKLQRRIREAAEPPIVLTETRPTLLN